MARIYQVDENGKKILDIKKWKIENYNKLYFDSNFELQCYKLLNKSEFDVDFHPEPLLLAPGFNTFALTRSKGKTKIFKSTVRPITYTPDFCITCRNGARIYVETKGFFREGARLRFKLAQAALPENTFIFLIFDTPKEGLNKLQDLIEIIKTQFGGSGKSKEVEKKVISKKTNI